MIIMLFILVSYLFYICYLSDMEIKKLERKIRKLEDDIFNLKLEDEILELMGEV